MTANANYTANRNVKTNVNRNARSTANSTNYTVSNGIRRSFPPARTISAPAAGADRKISYGDKMFARLVMHGRTIAEFMVSSVSNLSELWGILRRKCRGMRGLAKLYLRNASRGWSMERPMMLYPDIIPHVPASDSRRISEAFRGEARQLSFPWEL